MAKYVQPNFIIESSANFTKNVSFQDVVHFKEATNVDASLYVKGIPVGSMIYESSLNYYDASTVDILIDAIDVSTTLKFVDVDSSISRIDASLNDVIDITDVIDASLAEKVDKAGDTMTGELVLDAGFQLDGISITTIDTSAEGLSQLDTAIPTSGAVKALVDSAITEGVTASNGLTETAGDIQLGGSLTKTNTSISGDDISFNIFANNGGNSNFARLFISSEDNDGQISLQYNDATGNTDSFIDLDSNGIQLKRNDIGTFSISGGGIVLTDSRTTKVGMEYADDYSDYYTARSLVDKGYVDTAIIDSSISASNGLTETGGDIQLGGSITSDISININSGSDRFSFINQDNIHLLDIGLDKEASYSGGMTNLRSTYGGGINELKLDSGSGSNKVQLSIGGADYLKSNLTLSEGFSAGATYVKLERKTDLGAATSKNSYLELGDVKTEYYSDSSVSITYAADYSDFFVPRSLVDKGYVDAAISTGAFVLTDGNGTTANGTAVDLGGALSSDANIITGTNKLFVTGEMNIVGNLIVDGSTTSVSSVNLDVSDNIITINSGETGSGVSKGYAGLLVDRGIVDPYVFVFDETSDTFRVGIGTESGLPVGTQAVATREDAPTVNGIGFWNNTENRIDTSSGLVFTYGVGVEYEEELHSSYTDRTLVDKEYVDNKAGTIDAWNGLSNTDGSIGLGGEITQDIALTFGVGSAHKFNIGQQFAPAAEVSVVTNDSINFAGASSDFTKIGAVSVNVSGSETRISLDAANGISQASSLFDVTTSGLTLSNTINDGELVTTELNIIESGINVSSQDSSFGGIKYTQDISTNFTDRSLVDKAYVDTKVGTIDAWNGLSNTDGSIGLGGTLTSNTEVTNDYNGSTFATRIGDTDAENYNNYTPTQTYLTLSDSITYDQAYIDLNLNSNAPKIDIFTSNAGGDKVGLYIDGSLGEESLTIKDDVNSKGIVYATDYSTNFTDRSLVDKGYVDGQVSQAVSTGAFKYSGTFDGTADVSALITAATHTLGTGPFMISVYEDDIQVVPDISFNTSGDVKIEWGIGTLNTNCSYIIIG